MTSIFEQIEILKVNGFETSLSGGINRASLENFMNSNIKIDYLKTGLFSVKLNKNNSLKLATEIVHLTKSKSKHMDDIL